jgi:DNA-binding NarL/FixJ family response regulator
MPIARFIRILIVDDHAIVREGLKQIIGNTADLSVAGETDSGIEAIKIHRRHAYDVLLLDISMPIKCGIEVLKQFKSEFPQLPVLMLSIFGEDTYAYRLLRAGAVHADQQSSTARAA